MRKKVDAGSKTETSSEPLTSDSFDGLRLSDLSCGDGLLKERELAKIFRCSHRTLENNRRKGLAPVSIRVGRLVRYRQSDVLAWLEKRSSGYASAP